MGTTTITVRWPYPNLPAVGTKVGLDGNPVGRVANTASANGVDVVTIDLTDPAAASVVHDHWTDLGITAG